MPGKEDHTERILGVLLRAGAMAAATVVLAGGIWYMAKFGTLPPHYRTFRGEPQDLRSVAGIWHGVLHGQPRSLIQFGLLLLIATPIARVVFSVIAFALERDKLYFALTLAVLSVLVWSLSGMGYAPH